MNRRRRRRTSARAASAQRRQAMFDWWERLFDYTVMRRESRRSREQPAWLLFHESAESHTDSPADLVRHLGVDLRHDTLVLQYYQAYAVTSATWKMIVGRACLEVGEMDSRVAEAFLPQGHSSSSTRPLGFR